MNAWGEKGGGGNGKGKGAIFLGDFFLPGVGLNDAWKEKNTF